METYEKVILSSIIFILIGIPLITINIDKTSCYRSFPNFEKKYDWMVGCQINTKENGWIPTENYRDIK